jgi:hypothetical protein
LQDNSKYGFEAGFCPSISHELHHKAARWQWFHTLSEGYIFLSIYFPYTLLHATVNPIHLALYTLSAVLTKPVPGIHNHNNF